MTLVKYEDIVIEKPFIPLSSYADDTSFKLYMSDVGILRKLSKLPYEVVLDATPTYKEFKGSMTENYVLCELLKSVDDTAYYWSSGTPQRLILLFKAVLRSYLLR